MTCKARHHTRLQRRAPRRLAVDDLKAVDEEEDSCRDKSRAAKHRDWMTISTATSREPRSIANRKSTNNSKHASFIDVILEACAF